jgi:para-nitrobenzyl esterase
MADEHQHDVPSVTSADPNGEAPIARLRGGLLRGARVGKLCVFKGVRYGEDTAKTRFRRAEPAKPWPGTRDAISVGNQCPQHATFGEAVSETASAFMSTAPQSEDCLFLNIWTGGVNDGEKRPVMVWLHGGGYAFGSGSAPGYDGGNLASRGDVVVVTVTHRLNVFGYLYLADILGPDFSESGNIGNLDIVLALEWVRDNITAFGGDPDNVTIFGQSGGGYKVSHLRRMKVAKGLFHKACQQSGGDGVGGISPAEATQLAEDILANLSLSREQAQELLTLPAQQLVKGLSPDLFGGALRISPVADGVCLPPFAGVPAPATPSAYVPLLVGSTEEEFTQMIGMDEESLFHLDWDSLHTRLSQFLEANKGGMLEPRQTAVLDDVAAIVSAARDYMPHATPSQLFWHLTSFVSFNEGALWEAQLKAEQGGAKAYHWMLTWCCPLDGGKWGAGHGMETPFVFDNAAQLSAVVGPASEETARLTDQMADAWIAFARTGNPDHPAIPHWPAYDLKKRPTMLFDVEPKVIDDWQGGARRLFMQAD